MTCGATMRSRCSPEATDPSPTSVRRSATRRHPRFRARSARGPDCRRGVIAASTDDFEYDFVGAFKNAALTHECDRQSPSALRKGAFDEKAQLHGAHVYCCVRPRKRTET